MLVQDAAFQFQSCLAEGGPFAAMVGVSTLIAGALVAGWLIRMLVQAQWRRDDLRQIQNLLIEGSLGEAILLADRRDKDPLFAVIRTAITTMQSTRSRSQAIERVDRDSAELFRTAASLRPLFGGLAVVAASLVPAGLAVAGQRWAYQEIAQAVEAMRATLDSPSPAAVDAIWAEGFNTLIYTCPPQLGIPASLILVVAALALTLWQWRRGGAPAREQARRRSYAFVEMAARVLDPSQRAYSKGDKPRARSASG